MGKVENQRETNNPRDPMQSLIFSKFPRNFEKSVVDEEESIELSLGLSLNGRFGVDPQREKHILSRSSSVSDFAFALEKKQSNEIENKGFGQGLMRTCSLPAEGEEEWRKRKEAQSARRMEAKRKRVEKLRNLKSQGSVDSSFGENLKSLGKLDCGGVFIPPVPSSQGSIGSVGSGSSGVFESGLTPSQGMNRCTEARCPVHLLPKQDEQKPVVTPTGKSADFVGAAMENPSVKLAVNNAEATEIMRNMLVDMPCVSTRGFGPNGKRVEGFLYRYRKGEQVRIVCVCHGSFLSPAEFVKHAGGGDVSQPLKHIVVSPSALL